MEDTCDFCCVWSFFRIDLVSGIMTVIDTQEFWLMLLSGMSTGTDAYGQEFAKH